MIRDQTILIKSSLSPSNAVLIFSLRNFLRNRNYINSKVKENEEAFWNYPQWWINKTKMNWPNDWQKILKSGNNIPPLTLRVNKKKISVCDYLSLLYEKSLIAEQIGP